MFWKTEWPIRGLIRHSLTTFFTHHHVGQIRHSLTTLKHHVTEWRIWVRSVTPWQLLLRQCYRVTDPDNIFPITSDGSELTSVTPWQLFQIPCYGVTDLRSDPSLPDIFFQTPRSDGSDLWSVTPANLVCKDVSLVFWGAKRFLISNLYGWLIRPRIRHPWVPQKKIQRVTDQTSDRSLLYLLFWCVGWLFFFNSIPPTGGTRKRCPFFCSISFIHQSKIMLLYVIVWCLLSTFGASWCHRCRPAPSTSLHKHLELPGREGAATNWRSGAIACWAGYQSQRQ